ncbi:putative serine dehydratase domain-containing protein [Pseudomassariella vexata]|uniref:D-serine dehydratase n=1 Tax=Pseudomassariella vexata TaxID=1141098 RepID=A0A1Y2D6A0_9PEZI|nr:putative serine dehydratase domain-containing protein [Pseudomassariella vexata]ORY54819.1 putative serine dehydratase domain-domain-containing protein [Pseudomassariella vexata]
MAVHISKDLLKAQYVGKSLYQVPTPACVLDLAKLEANCNLMLEASQRLDLSWRAHIKTHKTAELTRLQVGDDSSSAVNIIVSTLTEAENVVPLLQEFRQNSRKVNVLYCLPIYTSCVDRLAQVSAQLGPNGLTVMVDHPDQLKYLTLLASKSGNPPLVFLKINVGSNRAGVFPGSAMCNFLVDKLLVSEAVGSCVFLGVYTHASKSYETRDDWQALDFLGLEFNELYDVARVVRKERPNHPLVLSVGATPTATSLQHPDFDDPAAATTNGPNAQTSKLASLIQTLKQDGFTLEVHAGVYPTLDIQQLAAHSRDSKFLNSNAIAISVLVEVASLYPGRGPHGTTEALVNAGTLAIGREPCKDMGSPAGIHYSNWGIVSPWNAEKQPSPGKNFPAEHGGWQIGQITQEHGILTWVGEKEDEVPLYVGQRLRVWPNHACITSAGHAWYLIVDSRNQGRKDEIVDVWVRWNGW